MDYFSYFLLRLRSTNRSAPAADIRGIIQQLSTGEKQAFHNSSELLELLRVWPEPPTSPPVGKIGEASAVVRKAGERESQS